VEAYPLEKVRGRESRNKVLVKNPKKTTNATDRTGKGEIGHLSPPSEKGKGRYFYHKKKKADLQTTTREKREPAGVVAQKGDK